jgi:hypothetical protein
MKKWLSVNFSFFIMLIAFSSFAYSIYRADINQQNNISREAGFQLLKELNQLQLITDKELYGNKNQERFIDGWSNVMMIGDLSVYFEKNVQSRFVSLEAVWKKNFESLEHKKSNEKVSTEIKKMREEIKDAILHL